MNKDLLEMVMTSKFNNVREGRACQDQIRTNKKLLYKDNILILKALIRLLLFESTKLVSDPTLTSQIVEYDTTLHQRLCVDSLFAMSHMTFVNKDAGSFPARAFYVFVHNEPLS